MITIQRKYHFYAAHRNKQAGEKCGRIHGHTYELVCHFQFNDTTNGIAMLFADIDMKMAPIISYYDHYLLLYHNDPLVEILEKAGEDFHTIPCESSAENLAHHLFLDINGLAELPIYKLELAETKSSNVIYEP